MVSSDISASFPSSNCYLYARSAIYIRATWTSVSGRDRCRGRSVSALIP